MLLDAAPPTVQLGGNARARVSASGEMVRTTPTYKGGGVQEWQNAQLGAVAKSWSNVGRLLVNGRYVYCIGSGDGTAAWSYDGTSWSTYTAPLGISRVATSPGWLTGITPGANWMRSSDGINWTTFAAPVPSVSYSAFTLNGLAVALRDNGSAQLFSTDGFQNYTTFNTPATGYWSAAYGNGVYALCPGSGMNTGLYVSSSLTGSWTTVNTLPSQANGYFIAGFGNGYFMLVGGVDKNIWMSVDGVNWTNTSNITALHNGGSTYILFANGLWHFTDGSSPYFVCTSPDGVVWTKSPFPGATYGVNSSIGFSDCGFFCLGNPTTASIGVYPPKTVISEVTE